MKKEFQFEAITKEQIRSYAEASGDFNKIHLEESFAKEAGLPGIIAHGMLSFGLAARALEELNISTSALKSFEAKFKDKVLPGDCLKAEVEDINPQEFRIRILRQDGVEVLQATAKC